MPKPEPKSNLEWKEWGKNDPLFGVAAWQAKGMPASDGEGSTRGAFGGSVGEAVISVQSSVISFQ